MLPCPASAAGAEHRPGTGRALGLAVLELLALAVLPACSSLPWSRDRLRTPQDVTARLEEARADAAAGRNAQAIARLRSAPEVEDLPPELRIEVEAFLEAVAGARIRELEGSPEGAGELEDMVDLGLPGPLAVTAGVSAARKYLEAGRLNKSFKLLADLEQKYPTHHERREAGEILAEAGLRMADEPDRFLGFFSLRDEGLEALEWLTVTYPSETRCDEAYFKLAGEYAEDRSFQLSVRRYEDLVAYHLRSSLSIEAQARIPRMRLAGLESPEYDRRELARARRELEAWLEKHAGHELEPAVRLDYADCLRRLVLSDREIARFYLRIGQPFGTRIHAARALDTARLAGDEALQGSCRNLLAKAEALESRRKAAERFLDTPEAEQPTQEALTQPVTREDGGGQP